MQAVERNQKHKTLIIAPAWIGDMVMSQAVVKRLVELHPDGRIDVVAPLTTCALGARMPGVTTVIPLPIQHGEFGFRKRLKVSRRLRGEGYTQALVLPNSWKSALLPVLAGIALRTGWRGEMRFGLLNDVRTLDEKLLPRLSDRFLALATTAASGLPACAQSGRYVPQLRVDEDNVELQLARLRLQRCERGRGKCPVIALCPGAEFGPAKRWPAAHYAALADRLVAAGAAVWLFGSSSERSVGDEIMRLTDPQGNQHIRNLIGRTTLLDAIDLLSVADVAVSNDSGLMHVAAAVDVPVVALFGSTSPDFTPPLGRALVLQESLPCQPCFARTCPLGHLKCLRNLSVATVSRAVEVLLAHGTVTESMV